MRTFSVVAILSLLLVGTFLGEVAFSQSLVPDFTSPDSGFFSMACHEGTGEMWAGTYGGRIFVKRGGTWQLRADFSSIAESIYVLEYHPATNKLYAVLEMDHKDPCIYRLDGDTWVSTGYGNQYSEPEHAMGLGLGVGAGGYIYAGVTPHVTPSKGYVWRSIDGITWSSFTTAPSCCMGFDALGGQTYACTTYGHGDLLRLNGTTWQVLFEGTDIGFYGDLKEFKGNLYASGEDRNSNHGVIYRWNGSSCTKVLDVVGGCFEKMTVAKDGAGTEWLYAPWTYGWRATSGSARIYRTSDGTNWSLFQSFVEAECAVAAKGENEYTLYAATRQEGGHGKIYRYQWPVDTTPPSVPTNVVGTPQSATSVLVTWTASTDNVGVTGYKVYRNGSQVGTSAATSYLDTGLTANTTYSYTVSAHDAAANNSAQSSPAATAHTPSPDTTPPSVPTNVAAAALGSSSIKVTWTASTDNVAMGGYKVYRNSSQVGTSATTNYANTGLSASTTYSYTVSAYDGTGNSSAQSSPPATARTLAPFTITNVVPSNYVVTTFNIGSTIFIDRTYTITDMPSQYQGHQGIRTANNDKDNPGLDFHFTISGGAYIYVCLSKDTQPTTPLLTGFVDTGDDIETTDQTYSVFRKWYPAGVVSIGPKPGVGNGYSMYFVLGESVADPQAPSVPTGVTATAQSSSSILVSWTASTDNVGVTGYKV